MAKEKKESLELDDVIAKINKDFDSIVVLQKYDEDLKDTSSIIDVNYEFFMNQIISQFVIIDKIPFYILNLSNYNFHSKSLHTKFMKMAQIFFTLDFVH